MSSQHSVYLAVPGKQVCWGTVLGVVQSTQQHVAKPFNGGFGFSGTEDFNILWTDAHNLYESGDITHFAMLHGDITPDPSQHWLDILLEEMDARNAALVSAVSPIKDPRGLSSSGIADLDDPWKPYRRFTMREIHHRLPETFDNRMAGYPDRPLLHNTGLWVCDLRRPEFRQSVAGKLDLYFEFPTQATRGQDGKWRHQRESEDWAFSRALWLRGVRDTYITRRVRLTHHGKMDFTNGGDWGTFGDGDDDTADKWRADEAAKPLHTLQVICFELGKDCNLGTTHAACPNRNPERFALLDASRELDDDAIVAAASEAYNRLGFTGLVAWHYYNEPLLQADRMFSLMARITLASPGARFLLWTNGTKIPEDCERFRQFEQIFVSEYTTESRRGYDRLAAKGISARVIENAQFDDRLVGPAPPYLSEPCLRPFVELIFDAYGNAHLCCYDWRGEGTIGNLHAAGIAPIAIKWREMLPNIAGREMGSDAPAVCQACGHRWQKYQTHDEAIVQRARQYRAELMKD